MSVSRVPADGSLRVDDERGRAAWLAPIHDDTHPDVTAEMTVDDTDHTVKLGRAEVEALRRKCDEILARNPNETDPVADELAAALSAWHGAIARADAAFSHGAAQEFEWAEAVSALDAARRLASCAGAARAYVAEAEKRGAERATAATVMGGQRFAVVWGLREAAAAWRANGLTWDDPDEETNTDLRVARSLDARADRIERGEQA